MLRTIFVLLLLLADEMRCLPQPQQQQQDIDDVIDCTITQWGGPAGPGKDCKFPFKFQGRTFNLCTTATEGDRRPWCPTELSDRGVFREGSRAWSYCDPNCAFLDAKLRRVDRTTPRPDLRRGRPRRTTTKAPDELPSIFTLATERTTTTSTEPTAVYEETNPDSLSGSWLPDPEAGECGLALYHGFVIGGEQAGRGEYPFMALLGYWEPKRSRVEYRCGGTLVNRRYVVTAAHCHVPDKLEVASVVLGEWDVSTDPDCNGCRRTQRFLPEEVLLHPDWQGTGGTEGDIALIRLDRMATTVYEDLESVVLPACLGPKVSADKMANITVAGWGKTTNLNLADVEDFRDFAVSQRTLQKLGVPLMKYSRCKAIFPKITRRHLCAGGNQHEDSCNGDSGGPLIGTDGDDDLMYLLGVVSSGTKSCGIGKPGIYTKVEDYTQWIKDSMKP